MVGFWFRVWVSCEFAWFIGFVLGVWDWFDLIVCCFWVWCTCLLVLGCVMLRLVAVRLVYCAGLRSLLLLFIVAVIVGSWRRCGWVRGGVQRG